MEASTEVPDTLDPRVGLGPARRIRPARGSAVSASRGGVRPLLRFPTPLLTSVTFLASATLLASARRAVPYRPHSPWRARARMWSAVRKLLARMVRVGAAPPEVGMKLPSTTKRLGDS